MNLPKAPDELLPYLASFGAAIGLGKLLASKQRLTLRLVIGRAIEGSALCMCAGVGLLLFPSASPFAVLGIGGLLAVLGVAGGIALVRAWKGGDEK